MRPQVHLIGGCSDFVVAAVLAPVVLTAGLDEGFAEVVHHVQHGVAVHHERAPAPHVLPLPEGSREGHREGHQREQT